MSVYFLVYKYFDDIDNFYFFGTNFNRAEPDSLNFFRTRKASRNHYGFLCSIITSVFSQILIAISYTYSKTYRLYDQFPQLYINLPGKGNPYTRLKLRIRNFPETFEHIIWMKLISAKLPVNTLL